MNPLADRIGKRLKLLRVEKGMTLEDLAAKCLVTKGFLSLVENGFRVPSLEVLDRIATVLQVDLKEML